MGTITMTGFNSIDWGTILEAVMKQESQPLTSMQTQRADLQSKISAYGTLSSRVSALESAAQDLTDTSEFGGRTATSSDSAALAVSARSTAALGTYDVVVTALAKAQVTTMAGGTPLADKDKTVVATGGNLTFLDSKGAQLAQVSLSEGSYTLEQLAEAINSSDAPAHATIVQASGAYKLVLTGADTGLANAFTVQNNLTGGTPLVQAAAQDAADADITVNNVRVTSSSNVIADAIDGVTLTLLKATGTTAVPVSVAEDTSVAKTNIKAFITAFNALVDFANKQAQSARDGNTDTIGYDTVLRSLRGTMSSVLNRSYNAGGAFTNLSQIGIEFDRSGKLQLKESAFDDAMTDHQGDVERLLGGALGTNGAFDEIRAAIDDYSKSGGFVLAAQARLRDQVTSLDKRISDMEERLALRRLALQKEYAAADSMISQLNSQGSSLSALLS